MLFSCYVTCTKTEMAHDIILLCACVPCKVTAQWSALYPDFTLSLCSVIDCQQGSIYEKKEMGIFWGSLGYRSPLSGSRSRADFVPQNQMHSALLEVKFLHESTACINDCWSSKKSIFVGRDTFEGDMPAHWKVSGVCKAGRIWTLVLRPHRMHSTKCDLLLMMLWLSATNAAGPVQVPFGTQVDPKNITSGGSSDTPREWALLGGILGHTWALPAVDILSDICKEAAPGDAAVRCH